MEFLFGGLAACGAGFFTNPLEVVKTRLQLQGELQLKGQYQVHYKNVFHAFYAIAKSDGVLALQKGLVPALWYQFFMNGCRLGAYQCFTNLGLLKDPKGNFSFSRSIVAGATAGCIGAVIGSPIYMVKTQLQARATQEIAVGYQHQYDSMLKAFQNIFKEHGILGLWRGVSAAVIRVMIGSATQLTTFSQASRIIEDLKIFKKKSILSALTASMLSGIAVVVCMTPFDVVSTRLYNQGVDAKGKGLYYNGFLDCFIKILTKEGFWGFYKGWAASLFRLGPHTVLSLVIWDRLRFFYIQNTPEKED